MRRSVIGLGFVGLVTVIASAGCATEPGDDDLEPAASAQDEVIASGTTKLVVDGTHAAKVVGAFSAAASATGGAGSSFVSVTDVSCTRGRSCTFVAPGFEVERRSVTGAQADAIADALEAAGVVAMRRAHRGGTAPVTLLSARSIDCRVSNHSGEGRCEIVVPDCRATGCGAGGGSCQLCFATWQCSPAGQTC